MRLAASTWPEVESYLKNKNAFILPIGSTEQHGPTGPIGTDYLCADAVARAAGEKLKMLVAPPLCYGVASHHMGFSGSVTIKPSVYQALLVELLHGAYRQGFRRFYLVNGHGGNDPSIHAAFQELKHLGTEGASFELLNWWKLPEVAAFARETFGNEEGSHATPTEVSLAFHLEQISPRAYQKVPEGPPFAWPLSAAEMRRAFPTGTIRSNPGLATPEFGKQVLEIASSAVVRAIENASFLD
ncbi:MAG: hypothetical protein A2X94_03960 [Bdellovibrionales bacterium GWB1_55_8]|nr:MAG: hypothetical protein A2X94_03960 [Bdellovibrionales bacterium GWB1_55_8]